MFLGKKFIFSFLAVVLISALFHGQRHEIGIQLGASNLVGDIGRTNYVLQKPFREIDEFGIPFYGGVLYRLNFNPYQTLRFDVGFNHIQFDDKRTKEAYRTNRAIPPDTNSAIEANVLFEYNFFPVNDAQKSLLSPYIFGGIGALFTQSPYFVHQFYRDSANNPRNPNNSQNFQTLIGHTWTNKIDLAIPFGVGLKYKFNYNWAIFGEFMFRPTFSDSIDYSVIDESSVKVKYSQDKDALGTSLQDSPYVQEAEQRIADYIQNRAIGNTNSEDWINSMTLGLSYSFGRPPCYCGN